MGSGAVPNDFSLPACGFQKRGAVGRPRLLIALRLLSAQHRQAITPPPPPLRLSPSLSLSVCRSICMLWEHLKHGYPFVRQLKRRSFSRSVVRFFSFFSPLFVPLLQEDEMTQSN